MQRRIITAEIVAIGNSRGLRIPKPIREELGLEGPVTMTVSEDALVIRAKRSARMDWAERFAKIGEPVREALLIPDRLGTDFDSEWTW